MRVVRRLTLCILMLSRVGFAAPKPHVVAFGKWMVVKCMIGEEEHTAVDLKMRVLMVDGQAKEFITGLPHDVTDRTFVVQRVFRVNDSLSQETGTERWRWERGGWVLVNRTTGKIQQIPLPEFDPYNSDAAWFRDYAAYCGLSDDGKKASAIIVQLGRRKPLLKKPLGDAAASVPDAECPEPVWQREPARVTFDPKKEQAFTFTVPTRSVDLAPEEENAAEE